MSDMWPEQPVIPPHERAERELRWVGVDLDKTLANNTAHPDYELLEPIDGAVESMKKLHKDGWKLIIYTARPWHDYEKIENWLLKYNIPHRRIVCGKLFVRYMIDDRNIEFRGDWEEVLNKIKE